MTSSSVVQAVADAIWRNGLPLTRRGAGRPIRPPAVWTNLTQPGPISGSFWINGYVTPGKARVFGPIVTRVVPMTAPPE